MAAVLARLRADVQGAERLDPPQSAGLSGWTAAPLVLHQSHGLTLYRFEGAAIERVAFDLAGHELGRLALVREGAAWRWRQIDAGLVEVSIAFLAAPGAPGAAGRAIHRDTLRLTLRGAPGRWGW